MRFLIVIFHCLGGLITVNMRIKMFYFYECKGRRKWYLLQSNDHLPISTSGDELGLNGHTTTQTVVSAREGFDGACVFLSLGTEPGARHGQCKTRVLSSLSGRKCPTPVLRDLQMESCQLVYSGASAPTPAASSSQCVAIQLHSLGWPSWVLMGPRSEVLSSHDLFSFVLCHGHKLYPFYCGQLTQKCMLFITRVNRLERGTGFQSQKDPEEPRIQPSYFTSSGED